MIERTSNNAGPPMAIGRITLRFGLDFPTACGGGESREVRLLAEEEGGGSDGRGDGDGEGDGGEMGAGTAIGL